MNINRILICITIFLLLLSSCSDSDSDDNEEEAITFNGSFDSNLNINLYNSKLQERIPDIQNYNICLYHSANQFSESEVKPIEIDESGNFTFDVPDGNIFAAFLVNPNNEFRKVIGLIGLSTGEFSYWEAIDTDYITNGTIDLGKISDLSGEEILVPEIDINSLSGYLTNIDEIIKLSFIDNAVRIYKNRINSGEYDEVVRYFFEGGEISHYADVYLSPEQYTFSGYNMKVYGTDFLETDTLVLIPPDDVTDGVTTFNSGNPLAGEFTYHDMFQFCEGGPYLQNFVDGYWELEYNNEKVVEWDFGCVNPLTEGNINIPVPVPCFVTEGSTDIISEVHITWYILNDENEYIQMEPELLDFYLNTYEINLEQNWDDDDINQTYSADIDEDGIILTQEWHINEPSDSGFWLKSMRIKYELNHLLIRVLFEDI